MSRFDITGNLFTDSSVRKNALLLALVLGLSSAAPRLAYSEDATSEPTPFALTPDLASPAESASPAPAKVATQTVHFDALIPFLPEAPAGWTAEAPQGDTSDSEDFNISTVQRIYAKGVEDDSPSVSISIIDPGNNEDFVKATTEVWKVTSETEDGYDRPINLDGKPGYEHYSKLAKTTSLSLFVGNRFFVQIDITNLEPKEIKTWVALIDMKKLAALK